MSAPKVSRTWSVGGCITLTVGLMVLLAQPVVNAQSDCAPSSCCACHIWEDPVVEQGEWHTIHALQMPCCACHGGNDQAYDQELAHAGLTSHPLNNPYLSCRQCHSSDYQQRAAGVAVALGLAPNNHEPTAHLPVVALTPAPSIVTPWPQITFRGWDWPVELAVAIVVLGLGVMRWHRVHSSRNLK